MNLRILNLDRFYFYGFKVDKFLLEFLFFS